jgi:hypothetical protein
MVPSSPYKSLANSNTSPVEKHGGWVLNTLDWLLLLVLDIVTTLSPKDDSPLWSYFMGQFLVFSRLSRKVLYQKIRER